MAKKAKIYDTTPLTMGIAAPAYLPSGAKIALIPDCPTKLACEQGKALAGLEERLLTELAGQIGVALNEIAVIPFCPFHILPRGLREPAELGLATLTELLAQNLSKLPNPVTLMPMGPISLSALTGHNSISNFRGSILNTSLGIVIPTYDLTTVFREYLFRYPTLSDMRRAFSFAGQKEATLKERTLILGPSFSQALDYLDEAALQPMIAFDIECNADFVTCFSLALSATSAICIPLVSGGTNSYWTPPQEAVIWHKLRCILENPAIVKLGQNLNFDASYLLRKMGIHMSALSPIEDTMIAQAICAPGMPKGLDYLCSIYTDQPYYKADGKMWFKQLGGSDIKVFWRYSALDSATLFDIHAAQQAIIAYSGNLDCYKRQVQMLKPLGFMQERGMRIDTTGIGQAADEMRAKLSRMNAEFQLIAPGINPASPKQLQSLFYEQLGYKPYTNRKTGGVTTDESALKRLASQGCKQAAMVLAIRREAKGLSTYLEMQYDEDARMRCSYNPVGTKQGRVSSSQTIFKTGGNLQTIPKEYRRYFLADRGYVMVELDLGQAENRIVAWIAPEPKMKEAFLSGADVHSLTAGLIFGKPPSQISDEPGSSKLGDGQHSERDWGKRANHALNYGMSPNLFSLQYEIPFNEAKFITAGYHKAYPGVANYHRWVEQDLLDRAITNLFGRTRIFLDRWGTDLFKEAYSYIPQSSVADKIRDHGLLPLSESYQHLELLNTVHDSILLQYRADAPLLEVAAELVALRDSLETAITYGNDSFVIPADAKIGQNWGGRNAVNPHGLAKLAWKSLTPDSLAALLEPYNAEARELA